MQLHSWPIGVQNWIQMLASGHHYFDCCRQMPFFFKSDIYCSQNRGDWKI
jgi:hypothetical protein